MYLTTQESPEQQTGLMLNYVLENSWQCLRLLLKNCKKGQKPFKKWARPAKPLERGLNINYNMYLKKKTTIKSMLVVLVAAMLSIVTLQAGDGPNDPRIVADKSSYIVGDNVTVMVSNIKNNGNIVVHYCLLDGRYSATNPSKKWVMNKSSNSKHSFGPMSDAWKNKWIKIIAENTTTGTWSNELYCEVKPAIEGRVINHIMQEGEYAYFADGPKKLNTYTNTNQRSLGIDVGLSGPSANLTISKADAQGYVVGVQLKKDTPVNYFNGSMIRGENGRWYVTVKNEKGVKMYLIGYDSNYYYINHMWLGPPK